MIRHPRSIFLTVLLALAFAGVISGAMAAEPALRVYAAGSLKGFLDEATAVFTAREGLPVKVTFGPAGLLRQRLQAGETADLFASADMAQPQALAEAGLADAPALFARSGVCALVRSGLAMTPDNFLDTLLRDDVRLGTSTPGADPGGDYAWALFHRADSLRPGSFAHLDGKAMKLVGGPIAPEPPAGRPLWAYLMEQADVFLLYCNTAQSAARQVPGATIIHPPAELAVIPQYGISILTQGDHQQAERFLAFLASPEAGALLVKWGFTLP
ncbi:extracellular solute-binding protein [Telmatospirillum sp.]|uniref:extracellular solute-binding protein n=1 Tax=Telmatospirillum sp. TaxID=2079197 RepID=UPI0028486349|nr:extracellular solute-binding protein [Telmatospirillum sp.]MDR3438376.1 extracellular solute-binding protein [Telmatospirillum sp.]